MANTIKKMAFITPDYSALSDEVLASFLLATMRKFNSIPVNPGTLKQRDFLYSRIEQLVNEQTLRAAK